MNSNKDNMPQATDEEVNEVLKKVLDEAEKEWDEEDIWAPTEEDLAFEKEFDEATTFEEETRVLEKYGHIPVLKDGEYYALD